MKFDWCLEHFFFRENYYIYLYFCDEFLSLWLKIWANILNMTFVKMNFNPLSGKLWTSLRRTIIPAFLHSFFITEMIYAKILALKKIFMLKNKKIKHFFPTSNCCKTYWDIFLAKYKYRMCIRINSILWSKCQNYSITHGSIIFNIPNVFGSKKTRLKRRRFRNSLTLLH